MIDIPIVFLRDFSAASVFPYGRETIRGIPVAIRLPAPKTSRPPAFRRPATGPPAYSAAKRIPRVPSAHRTVRK